MHPVASSSTLIYVPFQQDVSKVQICSQNVKPSIFQLQEVHNNLREEPKNQRRQTQFSQPLEAHHMPRPGIASLKGRWCWKLPDLQPVFVFFACQSASTSEFHEYVVVEPPTKEIGTWFFAEFVKHGGQTGENSSV